MFAKFTALALEPQRTDVGTASSLYGSITTLLGIGAGAVVGQAGLWRRRRSVRDRLSHPRLPQPRDRGNHR